MTSLWFPVVSSFVSFLLLLFPPRCVHSDTTLRSRCVYIKLRLRSVCKRSYLSCFYKKPLQGNRPFPASSFPLPVGARSLPVVTEGSRSVPGSLLLLLNAAGPVRPVNDETFLTFAGIYNRHQTVTLQ